MGLCKWGVFYLRVCHGLSMVFCSLIGLKGVFEGFSVGVWMSRQKHPSKAIRLRVVDSSQTSYQSATIDKTSEPFLVKERCSRLSFGNFLKPSKNKYKSDLENFGKKMLRRVFRRVSVLCLKFIGSMKFKHQVSSRETSLSHWVNTLLNIQLEASGPQSSSQPWISSVSSLASPSPSAVSPGARHKSFCFSVSASGSFPVCFCF